MKSIEKGTSHSKPVSRIECKGFFYGKEVKAEETYKRCNNDFKGRENFLYAQGEPGNHNNICGSEKSNFAGPGIVICKGLKSKGEKKDEPQKKSSFDIRKRCFQNPFSEYNKEE